MLLSVISPGDSLSSPALSSTETVDLDHCYVYDALILKRRSSSTKSVLTSFFLVTMSIVYGKNRLGSTAHWVTVGKMDPPRRWILLIWWEVFKNVHWLQTVCIGVLIQCKSWFYFTSHNSFCVRAVNVIHYIFSLIRHRAVSIFFTYLRKTYTA